MSGSQKAAPLLFVTSFSLLFEVSYLLHLFRTFSDR